MTYWPSPLGDPFAELALAFGAHNRELSVCHTIFHGAVEGCKPFPVSKQEMRLHI